MKDIIQAKLRGKQIIITHKIVTPFVTGFFYYSLFPDNYPLIKFWHHFEHGTKV